MAKGKKVRRKEKKSGNDNDKKEKPEENELNGKEHEERHGTTVIGYFKKDELQEIRNKLNIKVLTDNDMLLGAVALGKFDVVKKLLKQGSPINYASADNMTSLMWAVKCKRIEMMDLLIRRGADTTIVDSDGNNALLLAIQSSEWDQDSFLDFWHSVQESGCRMTLNQANKTGSTVLHYAVKRQWDNVLEEFIEVGADVNCVTAKGVTPLMMAGSRDDSAIVSKLLYAKADISCEDQRGCTALCYAISYMIQKRLESPNPSLQQFIEKINDPSSPLTLEVYLKRRLDLLVYPPEENFSSTINSLITHIVTFFVRYIQAGLELLLDLQVFVRVREATERHIEDIEYVLALLAVTLELVRSCKCCIGETAQQVIVKNFIEADIPETCLSILRKHGLAPLSNNVMNAALIPIMAVCTTESKLGKLWLQRNFSHFQPFYQKYYRTCIINFTILADDYHIRLLKRNIKEFQSLMQRIESGEVIVEETIPPMKKKKFIGIEEVNLQPPFRKESLDVINSTSSSEISKNKNLSINGTDGKDKEDKINNLNNCLASNENNLCEKTNSIMKMQKASSIALQDEYGKICNKNVAIRCKQNSGNVAELSSSLKYDDNYNSNKMKIETCHATKILEKPLVDIKIMRILQPNRLKQGETFSSVLQQSLNKEKYVATVIKQSGNGSQQINNTGTGDGIINKNNANSNDAFKPLYNNNSREDFNKENQNDTVVNEIRDDHQKRNNKLKSVFVANTHLNRALNNNSGYNNEDDDVIIESEFEENLSQKTDGVKNLFDNLLVPGVNGVHCDKSRNQNINNLHSGDEILFYEKLLNDVIDEYGAGGDINKDITEENMMMLSNSLTIYITNEECGKMIVCIDKLIKNIVNHYEVLWKNDWESGYLNATCGPHALLELMTKLPYYERIHLQRLIDIWDFLKTILITKTQDNCKIKKDVFKKLYNYLKNYRVKLENEVSNTINSQESGWYNVDMSMHKDILDFLDKDESKGYESSSKTSSKINNEIVNCNESETKLETESHLEDENTFDKHNQKERPDLKGNEETNVGNEEEDEDEDDDENEEDEDDEEESEEGCDQINLEEKKDNNKTVNGIIEVDEVNDVQLYQQNEEHIVLKPKPTSLEEQLDEYFEKETNNDRIVKDGGWNKSNNVIETNFKEEKYHESKWIWNNGQDVYLVQNSKSVGVINPRERNVNNKLMISELNNSLKTLIKHETMTTKTTTMHSISYRAILKHYSEDNTDENSVVNNTVSEKNNNCYRAILKRNDSLKTNCSLPSLSSLTPNPSLSSLSLPPPPPGFPPQPTQLLQPNNDDVTKWKFPISNKDRKSMYSSVRHLDQISKLRLMTPMRCQSFDSGSLTLASQDTYPEFKLFDGGNFGAVELGLDNEGYPLAVKRFTCFHTKGTKMTGTLLKSLVLNMLDLHHWNIVPYSICVDAEEQILIATPLCENNLVQYIKHLKETNALHANALDMVKQVFEGLHYLHLLEKPIIHGNLKPTNVLVDANGNLRLADFGLHKVLYKQMCPLGSTAIWWAQETYYVYQATWQIVCTLKSDVQVAGMLMHYILTGGLHPFGGDSPSILENLLAGVPALHTTISCDVNDLLSWMLVHSPLDRPNITTVLRHICFWPNNRKWNFILACSGLDDDGSKSILPLNEFFAFINRRAHEEKSSGDWVSIISENFPTLLTKATFDTENPSGLLQFINYCVTTTNLKDQLKEFFLQAFPNLALCLYRLIEDSTWQTHPALVRFTLWTSSILR